jgi:hypothetical protein
MRRRVAVWGGLGLLAATLTQPPVVRAQLPVCPQPSPSASYYTACASGARLLVARLLSDLAIDHLFKADTEPVRRRFGDFLRSAVAKDALEANGALADALDRFAPITLTKLDTTTGTLQLLVDEEDRRFSGAVEGKASRTTVSWELPARLAGGYWRTPATLQVAFWEGQRPRLDIETVAAKLSAEIECVAVSTDGVRVVTSGADTPDVLVHYDACE